MPLIPDSDPLLTLALIVLAGVASGIAARRCRLPGITGQIVVGVAMGSSGLHVFDHDAIDALQPFTHFALGLMAVTIGSHLSFRRLRGAERRLTTLLVAESLVTPLLVFGGMTFVPGIERPSALLLATLAISTAPVTIVALVKETRSKGMFVKTLVAAVALNNVSCILLFEGARAVARHELDASGGHGLTGALVSPVLQLIAAALLGGAATVFLRVVSRIAVRKEMIATAGAAAILLTAGMSDYVGVSPLLSCMFLGMIQTNTLQPREKPADSVFESLEPGILAVFFTLAGLHLSFDQAGSAGVAALAFFGLRAAGKVLSARWAMRLANATEKVRLYLGPALLPQAGIAIGLVILLQGDPIFQKQEGLLDLFVAVVLTVVTLNEIVGPIATRWALRKSGDYDKDRLRLMDFLQEENIVTDLDAGEKGEAIEQLVDVLIHSHNLKTIDRDVLLQSVLDREAQASTCLGGGLFVPHCILPEGHSMVGVMALSKEGLDFPTPDGRRVHCTVMLGTSPEERNRHLQVLAALARTIGGDAAFQDRLFNASNPAHAAELLHGEESEDFNYFLDG
ncbi:MAG: cation:proton antiporter [Planctomycetota bacterium]